MAASARDRWVSRARVAVTVLLLLVSTVVRRAVATSHWHRFLGRPQPVATDGQPHTDAPVHADPAERRAAGAVAAAARVVPIHTTCLDRALAGHLLLRLRHRPSTLVIGLDRADLRRGSHAWLQGATGAVLVGGEVTDDFVPVTRFGGR